MVFFALVASLLVVVADSTVSIRILPDKVDPPLVIDPDGALSKADSLQGIQAVTRGDSMVVQIKRPIQDQQPHQARALDGIDLSRVVAERCVASLCLGSSCPFPEGITQHAERQACHKA